ncbi:hypothetical protein PCS_02779 [Desulfocurvibacter africanus PCS]|uniref:Uncharacterized protein n=1 Tax=Desulfocurvibacter africanus PCS TaxID=1262666 RepID=M5PZZ7_DESAF|nr:hypothetical protein PCS_02779 [Desulfocurvibacter africanus PCS]
MHLEQLACPLSDMVNQTRIRCIVSIPKELSVLATVSVSHSSAHERVQCTCSCALGKCEISATMRPQPASKPGSISGSQFQFWRKEGTCNIKYTAKAYACVPFASVDSAEPSPCAPSGPPKAAPDLRRPKAASSVPQGHRLPIPDVRTHTGQHRPHLAPRLWTSATSQSGPGGIPGDIVGAGPCAGPPSRFSAHGYTEPCSWACPAELMTAGFPALA